MSLVTITWSMVAAACLTLAAIHFLVWLRRWRDWSHPLLACCATCVAVVAGGELRTMTAATPEQQLLAIDVMMVAIFWVTVSLILFLRVHFQAGRTWLMWTAIGGRAVTLLLNFVFEPNLHYSSVGPVRHSLFLGETVASINGQANKWSPFANFTILLVLLFVIDVMVTAWRRGETRRAVVICGGTVVFLAIASIQSALVTHGILGMPILVSASFLALVAAMTYELSTDLIRTAQLSESLARSRTELLASEKALRTSEEQFRHIVEASPNAMLMVDQSGTIVFVNSKAEQLFCYSRDELLGQQVEMLLPTAMRTNHAALRAAYHQCPTPRSVGMGRELLGCRKDGSQVPLEIGLSPVRTSEGQYVLASLNDLTAWRHAEAEAAHRRDELTHLSRVTMLGELAGSLAHELNQPLAAILNNAEAARRFLSRETTDLDEVRVILDDIVSDDNRAGEVIRRLRVLLRKGELDQQLIQINETIREVLKLMRGDLLNRNVCVQMSLADDALVVHADRVQMQQVLLNLISNACDAMSDSRSRGKQLTIATSARADGMVVVSVADQGCGIEPTKIGQIFESFYTTKDKGMGLGLAVCRTIVTAHGGRLWAENMDGQGAVFHVALPVGGKEVRDVHA